MGLSAFWRNLILPYLEGFPVDPAPSPAHLKPTRRPCHDCLNPVLHKQNRPSGPNERLFKALVARWPPEGLRSPVWRGGRRVSQVAGGRLWGGVRRPTRASARSARTAGGGERARGGREGFTDSADNAGGQAGGEIMRDSPRHCNISVVNTGRKLTPFHRSNIDPLLGPPTAERGHFASGITSSLFSRWRRRPPER